MPRLRVLRQRHMEKHADPESAPVVAKGGASALLMNMQCEPATMQDNPTSTEARREISELLETARRSGAAAAEGARHKETVKQYKKNGKHS